MTSDLGRQLLEAAQAIAPSMVADRRAIHANPELRYEEVATAAMAAGRLRELGYEVETGIGVTGVMEALPILEQNEAPYYSQNAGFKRCGMATEA